MKVAYCRVCHVFWDEPCRGNLTGRQYATYKHHYGADLARVECQLDDAPEDVQMRYRAATDPGGKA